MSAETLFTRIINGEIPAEKIYEDDNCICIKDIAPKAPIHVLLIPRKAIPRLADATAEDKALLGQLMLTAGDIARQLGVDDAFRLIVNNGEAAGQTVFHLHLHILAGKGYSEANLGF
ncbi:histidine triad nucleotide-binding protein [Pseudomaricurvus alcaniphilus]|uniref:histidine triad nucleotide-binding protein n=1 Tax=Pseudomaricurvus alcaniphilus TaxID=1166482 RepID=UPI001409F1FC|nr:histidine triad nucleotide-binding protein [Pseudomaricurvus alcaniphilus]NHN38352.1 histidine triad nucleotide-binding protein [Pseudomaricurvus alcaniphilus]